MRLATILFFVVLVVGGGIWWAVSGGLTDETSSTDSLDGLDPGAAPSVEEQSPAELAPAEARAESPEVTPREDLAPPTETVAENQHLTTSTAIPDDSLWVDGRLVLSTPLPPDESIRVIARGKRFDLPGRRKSVRTYSTEVAPDGTFRVAFAEGTRSGRVTLEARYVYLESSPRIDVREVVKTGLQLEPKVGGVIRASVTAPPIPGTLQVDLSGVEILAFSTVKRGGSVGKGPLDADGIFEALALAPGPYDLQVDTERFVPLRKKDVTVRPAETTEVELSLARGVRLRGRVVDPEGDGIAAAKVRVKSITGGSFEEQSTYRDTETVEDGSFDLGGIGAGELTLEVEADGFVDAELELGERGEGEAIDGQVIELSRGQMVAGIVLWPDGKPAVDAEVRVRKSAQATAPFAFAEDVVTETDSEGRFEVAGLDRGSLIVRAKARPKAAADSDEKEKIRSRKVADWIAECKNVEPGDTALHLVLESGGQLHGVVLDDTGKPVERFMISAHPDTGSPLGGLGQGGISRNFRSEDGTFLLEGLRDGDWEVAASARGHARSAAVSLTSPYGGPELQLVVPRYATITGRVQDLTGAPVSGAEVTAKTERGRKPIVLLGNSGKEKVATDEQGLFELKRINPGPLTVTASAEGYGSSEVFSTEIQPAAELHDLILVLRTPGRIIGEVDAATGPIAGRWIEVIRHEPDYRRKRVQSDETGQFAVEGLSPGEYTVILEPPAEEVRGKEGILRYAARIAERVELAEGETRHVHLGAPPERPIALRGRVLAAGRPVADRAVVARLRGEGGSRDELGARTDATGFFDMVLAAPGPYSFEFGDDWGNVVSIDREVPDQEQVALVFELPMGRISGSVRAPDGVPARGCPVQLEGNSSDGDHRGPEMRFAKTGDDGTFAFTHMPPGTYSVTAGGDVGWILSTGEELYGRQRIGGLELSEGQQLEDLRFDLRPTGAVEGHVYGTDGLPVKGATITPVDEGDSPPIFGFGSGRTDAAGHFKYRGLEVGKVRLIARMGTLRSEVREVTVLEGDTTSGIEFRLAPQ